MHAVLPLIRRVQDAIIRYNMIGPEDRVLVAASGGADSTALLLALHELRYAAAVAHVNHGLRGAESDADELFVKALAEKLNLPCFTVAVDVQRAGGNLESAGREARRAFFQKILKNKGLTKVALAHNRDDRIETFLMHLIRGAGSKGLTSMSPTAGDTIRPLLETPRQEVEAFLRALDQPWRTDSSNMDMSFYRNRMRHEVIPRLASLFNERLPETLGRTLTILHDEEAWMAQVARAWLDTHARAEGMNIEALRREPVGLVRRLIREALRIHSNTLTDVTFDQVEAVRSLLSPNMSGKRIPLPGGILAVREFNRLVFRHGAEVNLEFDYELPIPGSVRIPELGQVIRATEISESAVPPTPSASRVLVDGERLGPYVRIRSWRPGDYYRPEGWPAGKVKKLFQKARVPRGQRSRRAVLVSDSTIIWVASFPVSREYVPGVCSKKIVAFETLEG